MADKKPTRSYLATIDALRAVAVVSVIIFHFDAALMPAGFLGVDIFFLISGYIISHALFSYREEKFFGFILEFYKRRLVRIFPALIVMLLLTSLFAEAFIPTGWLMFNNAGTALWATLGLSNVYLWSVADGYFAHRAHFNPFLHTWSLGVEEQFYFVFPVLFYVFVVFSRRSKTMGLGSILGLAVLCTLSYGIAVTQRETDPVASFYLPFARFWELGLGALLFQLERHFSVEVKDARTSRLIAVVALLILLTLLFVLDDASVTPLTTLVLLVCCSAIILTRQSMEAFKPLRAFACNPGVLFVGRTSYSLYLWHWPVLTGFVWTVGLASLWHNLLALVLIVLLALGSFFFVEQPARRLARQQIFPRPVFVLILVAIVGVGFASVYATARYDHYIQQSVVDNNRCDWRRYQPLDCDGPIQQFDEHTDASDKFVLVIGDSHARAYSKMVATASQVMGFDYDIISVAGCPSVGFKPATSENPRCRRVREQVLQTIEEKLKPGDLVFLASLRVERLLEGQAWPKNIPDVLDRANAPLSTDAEAALMDQAISEIRLFESRGLEVLIDMPKPVFQIAPYRCSDWFNKHGPTCQAGYDIDRDVLERLKFKTDQRLLKLKEAAAVTLWDPFDVLCPEPKCSALKDNRPVFADGDHLSGYGNRLLVPSFVKALDQIWSQPS